MLKSDADVCIYIYNENTPPRAKAQQAGMLVWLFCDPINHIAFILSQFIQNQFGVGRARGERTLGWNGMPGTSMGLMKSNNPTEREREREICQIMTSLVRVRTCSGLHFLPK